MNKKFILLMAVLSLMLFSIIVLSVIIHEEVHIYDIQKAGGKVESACGFVLKSEEFSNVSIWEKPIGLTIGDKKVGEFNAYFISLWFTTILYLYLGYQLIKIFYPVGEEK